MNIEGALFCKTYHFSDEITLSNWTAEGEAVDWTPEKGYGQKKSFQDYAKKVFPRPALGTYEQFESGRKIS